MVTPEKSSKWFFIVSIRELLELSSVEELESSSESLSVVELVVLESEVEVSEVSSFSGGGGGAVVTSSAGTSSSSAEQAINTNINNEHTKLTIAGFRTFEKLK